MQICPFWPTVPFFLFSPFACPMNRFHRINASKPRYAPHKSTCCADLSGLFCRMSEARALFCCSCIYAFAGGAATTTVNRKFRQHSSADCVMETVKATHGEIFLGCLLSLFAVYIHARRASRRLCIIQHKHGAWTRWGLHFWPLTTTSFARPKNAFQGDRNMRGFFFS
jgi:hypothetical protein